MIRLGRIIEMYLCFVFTGRDAALIGGFCSAAFVIVLGFTIFIFYRSVIFSFT